MSEPVKLELGGGQNSLGGPWLNLDRIAGPGVHLVVDLDTLAHGARLPFADEAADAVYSSHCLEHVKDPLAVLREIARVCRAGASVEIRVPDWLSEQALSPGHLQTISPLWVYHVTADPQHYPRFWAGCPRRLRLDRTEPIRAAGTFEEAREAFPGLTDRQIERFIPGALHENRFYFTVIENA